MEFILIAAFVFLFSVLAYFKWRKEVKFNAVPNEIWWKLTISMAFLTLLIIIIGFPN